MQKLNFSYASKIEHNIAQRLIIKLIENLTGKRKLIKIYNNYELDSNSPADFWSDIIKLMEIKITDRSAKSLKIPKCGSLMIIANHPFGIIDGLILCSLVSKQRSDFKIMTHETLKFFPELDEFILPVDFTTRKKDSIKNNMETAKLAREHLLNKGALIIFPSGSVSTAQTIKAEARDDDWKTFPAKLIHQTRTDVIPIYFDGKNGLLFHLFASKMKNQTLKYSSYLHETRKKIGKEIIIYTGDLIKYDDISQFEDRNKLTNYLKDLTYSLKNN